ncbi:AraC family transcriptional regulator [Streptomyces sp. NPDC047108]|uniref:helix-turn-helix transcriptional regulator n=1 Tax=Streptomyces sp. NPDC047108 TaxID=3155025 RepID=UPI0033D1382C
MSEVVSGSDVPVGLQLVRTAVGEVTHPCRATLGPRLQRHVEVMLVHSGVMHVLIDDGPEFSVQAGSACLLLPGRTERFRFGGGTGCRQTWLRGLPRGLTGPVRERFDRVRPTLPLSSALEYLARETMAAERSQLTARGALLDALATAVVWRYVAEAESDPDRFPAALERARRHIHLHPDEAVDLADLARLAGVTPAHLIRLFREHLGTTPMRYLWDRRITLGVELLTSTGLPVGVVAERCGFRTSFHFARRVKQATGLSPTGLRHGSWTPG